MGGTTLAGEKLKETGTSHWNSPNSGATNESGFTALPAGYRGPLGGFVDIDSTRTVYWSSASYNVENAWYIRLLNTNGEAYNFNWPKQAGFSIRCVKD